MLKAKVIKYAAFSPLSYRLGNMVLSLKRKSPANSYPDALWKWVLDNIGDAYTGKKPVIWTNTFLSSEIVYGVEAVPILPEMMAGVAAALGLEGQMLMAAGKDWYSSDLCSVHRTALGLMKEGYLPRPDAVVCTDMLCDGARCFLREAAEYFRCPFHLLEIPYSNDADAEEWLAFEVKQLVYELCRELGTRDRLSLAIDNSNRARRWQEEVNRLRRVYPGIWSADHALNYAALTFMVFGSTTGAKFYEELAKSLTVMSKTFDPVSIPAVRLLWLHLKPYCSPIPTQFLENEGKAVVVFDEYDQLYWPALDSSQPYHAVAKKMLAHFGWGPAARRVSRIKALIDDYEIDGVIHGLQWGCRQTSGASFIIKKELAKMGIPVLNLDLDLIDRENEVTQQVNTRLQAFVEMIRAKKEGVAS